MDANNLGDRGEAIFRVIITKFHGGKPLFRAVSLGEKWPVADFAVELMDAPGKVFLVQVKTTQAAVGRRGRLPIDAKGDRVEQLLKAPLPSYLVAVHEPTEIAFIFRPFAPGRVRSAPTRFQLNDRKIQEHLFAEVTSFWESVVAGGVDLGGSAFVDVRGTE